MAPSNYSRIEINLLPPELRPRPAIRYTALVNAAIIAITLVFIGLSVYSSLAKLKGLQQQQKSLEAQIEERKPVRQDYESLTQIEADLGNYGRIISMASADYVDMPVVMARLAQLLPDGVYLSRVTNQGSKNRGAAVQLGVTLRSARCDTQLLIQTLTNLKHDPIMCDCYMRNADTTELQLTSLQDLTKAKWEVSTPAGGNPAVSQEYEFDLVVNISRVLPSDGLTAVADESGFFKGFELKQVPNQENGEAAQEVPGSRQPPKAEGAPANAKVEATN
jgi:hypothetical protein